LDKPDMKKEALARLLVGLFTIAAVSIPLAGLWTSSRAGENIVELHARTAENGGWSQDTIQARVGQPLHLHITSDDVVHGFAIGKSVVKPLDSIMPGEFVETTLTFTQPGKYTFYCNRWCGPNHWRMRGTIEVTGPGQPVKADPQPLYLKLGIDVDALHSAEVIPSTSPSADHGAQYAARLPAYATERFTYLTTSPARLWERLRADPTLAKLSDSDVWDAVAWIWQSQTTPQKMADGQALFKENCSACHAETGKGDGVMMRGLPDRNTLSSGTDNQNSASQTEMSGMGPGPTRPPDFTNPQQLLGASPALLEGKVIRGGMGTGMPYWGPIFTDQQLESIISYLYSFAWDSNQGKQSTH
jgi:mono/diheme cytochrome c family protein/plastocyanin